MEFRAGMAEPQTPAIGLGKYSSVLLSAALGHCIVKPDSASSCRCFHVVEPHIDVALGVSADVRDDIRPRARQESRRELRKFHIEVLHSATITAHVQYVEIIN